MRRTMRRTRTRGRMRQGDTHVLRLWSSHQQLKKKGGFFFFFGSGFFKKKEISCVMICA